MKIYTIEIQRKWDRKAKRGVLSIVDILYLARWHYDTFKTRESKS